MSLSIENPLPKLHRCRDRKRSSAASADDITHMSLPTVRTHSYLSEEDGYGEPESESITPRHTGTGTPVAAETDKLPCHGSMDTEGA